MPAERLNLEFLISVFNVKNIEIRRNRKVDVGFQSGHFSLIDLECRSLVKVNNFYRFIS